MPEEEERRAGEPGGRAEGEPTLAEEEPAVPWRRRHRVGLTVTGLIVLGLAVLVIQYLIREGSLARKRAYRIAPARAVVVEGLKVPEGFRPAPGTTADPATGWARAVVHEKTGIEMVLIPAGEFRMGSPETEKRRFEDEGPVHTVRLTRPFYIGTVEVTNRQFRRFQPDHGAVKDPRDTADDGQLPAVQVSFDDAQDFCKWADLELPTEAQWEYACRAGNPLAYSFSQRPDETDTDVAATLPLYAHRVDESPFNPIAVGQKRPNPWGLFDMHGNVDEWCYDVYAPYRAEAQTDPLVTEAPGEEFRAVRGGACNCSAGVLRSACRSRSTPGYRGDFTGFRCVRNLAVD